MSEPSPLDIDVLDESYEIDAEGTRQLIDMYFVQAGETVAGLRKAIAAGESANVDHLAHKLAGSSAVCGVAGMVGPLRALEQRGRTGQLSDAESLVATLVERLETCRQLLAEYFAKKCG